ncbi:cadherin domain-containing protein [Zoogloea sp.]|uniref:cadherin domain-containing protein n=1 Tax=Zoogloea sp. TaxID=49181 RepID=UPI001AD30FD1|nr:cadherin domain-containing protein [Zoogloea sp.]MBN8281906.1 cadherin domain-containing protein [Zoogloea sp.]
MKRRRHHRALIETFESRLLYSADPGPAGIVTAVLATPVQLSDDAIGLQGQATEIVFVDARTPDVQQIIDDLAAQQQAGRPVDVIVVGADEDGIGLIGSALSGCDEVSAIHLLGHGASGTAQLGASTLDAESIFQRAGEIAAWGDALTGEADLLLYGCDVGDGASGRSLVASLAQLTGADVAASDDPTGSAQYGGDWQLEVRSGTVEAHPFASADLQFEWTGTLALTSQGSETLVNTSTSGTQTLNWSSKSVAMDANGNYVIIWMDGSGQSDTGIGIFGQRYNASGVAQGAQFHVNTFTSDNQRSPQVAMDASGNFVVVWESAGQDGSSNGIYAQRYNSSGVAQGSEFRVNSTTTYDQIEAAVAMDASGNFVVAWQSWSQDLANSNGIYAQRYNSSGVAQGGEFLVNTYIADSQTEPSVAMDASGNFVIAWQSFGQDGSNEGIYAKRYNSSGVAQGSEFHVSTYTTSNQDLPVVAMDTSGNFVIVWESAQDGSGNGICGQRYNSSGVAQGGEFQINTTTSNQQQNPVVTMLAGGGFVVTWQSMSQDGSFDGVYMRQYDSSGTALTGEVRVNTTTTDYQDVPSLASDEKGHLVVVWHGNGPGDTDGVFMQRYLYAAAPVVTPTGYSGTYVENAAAIYDAGATVTDSDTAVFTGGQLIYQITANGTATDELGVQNQGTGAGQIGLSGTNVTYGGTTIGTYSGSFGNGSTPLTVTFNSNASVAAVQALVRNITYRNTSDSPSTATRTISLTVSDGTGMTSTPAVVTMAVTSVNDAPAITSAATANVAENTTAVMTVTGTDADQPAQTLTYSIVGGADAAKFAINSSTGALSFATAPDFEAPTDSGANNVYDVTVQASDGTLSSTRTVSVTVTAVNESAPVITSNGGGASASISIAENTLTVTSVTATDADLPASSFIYDISGGVDASKFTIDANSGVLQFVSAPDHENPTDSGANNVYNLIVRVSDGTNTDTQSIAVTVTNVASELIVTTAADTADGNTSSIANLVANKGADGKISLREAIIAANNTAGGDTITFAIGSGAQTINLSSALPTITSVVQIHGDSQAGFTGEPLIALNGASAGAGSAGLVFSGAAAAGSSVKYLAINNFTSSGIQILSTSNITVAGNYLGTNLAGTAAAGNEVGVLIFDAANNTIGGSTAATRNVISGNTVDGVQIFGGGATGNVVAGNYIGLDATGTTDLGNTNQGVAIFLGATYNIVGGTTAGARNVISGNNQVGVRISESGTNYNTISGNYIGTNAAGTGAIGNTFQGVQIDAGSANLIGGTVAGARNVISGNLDNGILITNGGVNNYVQGNIIGLDASGSGVLANTQEGIEVTGGAYGTWIGGTTSATRNIISGNAWQGIGVYGATTDGTVIRGNWIGVAADGTTAAGNEKQGILVMDATNTMIGGSNIGEGNVIANALNSHQGIVIYGTATGAVMIGNSIYANGSLGIDVGGDWINTNDVGDTDTGANNLQNTPELTSALTSGSTITIVGTLNSLASTNFRIEFFANPVPDSSGNGEGQSYLGFVDVVTNASGNASFSPTLTAAVPTGQVVTATATRLTSGMAFIETSEFAANIYTNPPSITSGGGGGTASVSTAENTTTVSTVTASDPDSAAQTLTYSIAGGADAATFAINGSTGTLSFQVPPNFEAPTDSDGNNTYNVTVQVADGTGAVDTQAITVSVTNSNDAPLVTFVAGNTDYAENAGPVIVAALATVADEDGGDFNNGRLIVQFTANGQAEDRIAIRNQGTGVGLIGLAGSNVTYGGVVIGTWAGGTDGNTPLIVTFNASADASAAQALGRNINYENVSESPSTLVRTMAGYVEDGDGGTSNVASGTVTIIPSNDAPIFTSSAAVDVAENSTAVTTITSSDPDGGVSTYAIVGGADAAKFAINSSSGALSFLAAPDFEAPTDAGGDNVYNVTVQVADGQGGTNSQAIAVTVTSANDNAPVITSGATASVAENTTAVMTVTATDTDQPTQTLSFSIIGGADAAKFAINASSGALSFLAAPDFEAPTDAGGDNVYDVTVQVSDGQGSTDSQAIAVTVTSTNDNAPTITSSATANVAENTTAVMTVTATDVDQPAQTLSYSIVGGADAAKFAINASTGALSFLAAPDFETPTDAGGDNVYDVTVQVSDGQGSTDSLAIAVTVTAGNDNAPVITSGATASVAENTTAVMTVTATDTDQPAQTLSFSITGGADAARFAIDAVSGALRFVSPPDFEQSSDANGDNVYEVVVSVSDGTLDTATSLKISVIGLNEAPLGRDGSIRLNEDESYVFSTADFGFSDPGDNHADQLAAVQIVGLPARGTLSLDGRSLTDGEWVGAVDIASGLLRYVPPADENGLPFTSLGFRVRDDGGTAHGGADTETGTHVLTIGVTPLSDAPMGTNDSYVLDEDGFIQLENSGILANDTDPDGLPLSAELVSGPANGQLTLESNGSFRFTPNADWNGVDGFSYRPSNGQEVGDIVRVTLTVAPVNDAPTLVKAGFPLTAGGTVTLGANAIQATDTDSPQSELVYEVVRTENGHFELTSNPGQAVSVFSHADLLAGRVVFRHQAFADGPVVVLRAGDGQSMGPELKASVAFSPAGLISTSPLPPNATQPDSGVANPSQGTTGALKPTARPATPSAFTPLRVVPEMAGAEEDGHSLHLADGFKTEAPARRSSLESLARFSKAQITLTLGTQPDGALLEFMLGAQDPAKADTGSTASRTVSDRTKPPPLPEPYADVQLVLHAVELSGIVLTAGAVWWASRASGLIAGLLMVAPAWRTLDPLPVLGPVDDSEMDWGRRMDDEMTRDEIGAADLFDQEREGWVR